MSLQTPCHLVRFGQSCLLQRSEGTTRAKRLGKASNVGPTGREPQLPPPDVRVLSVIQMHLRR